MAGIAAVYAQGNQLASHLGRYPNRQLAHGLHYPSGKLCSFLAKPLVRHDLKLFGVGVDNHAHRRIPGRMISVDELLNIITQRGNVHVGMFVPSEMSRRIGGNELQIEGIHRPADGAVSGFEDGRNPLRVRRRFRLLADGLERSALDFEPIPFRGILDEGYDNHTLIIRYFTALRYHSAPHFMM